MKKTAIIMGSDSDLKVAEKAMEVLKKLDMPFSVHVMSAHRTPRAVTAFCESARENGYGVLIAIAGKAAHLAGVIAAQTTLPVIGVPVQSSDLGGLDALLSTVQMPGGIPVATVAINGAANAAWLAARIFAVEDAAMAQKLAAQMEQMAKEVGEKDEKLQAQLREEA